MAGLLPAIPGPRLPFSDSPLSLSPSLFLAGVSPEHWECITVSSSTFLLSPGRWSSLWNTCELYFWAAIQRMINGRAPSNSHLMPPATWMKSRYPPRYHSLCKFWNQHSQKQFTGTTKQTKLTLLALHRFSDELHSYYHSLFVWRDGMLACGASHNFDLK